MRENMNKKLLGRIENNPKVMFERAKAYIQSKRNLDRARELLVRFLNSPLSPDDPSRREAEQLLKQARTG